MPIKKHLTADVPYRAFLVRCWQTETKSPETDTATANENDGWSFVVVPVHDSTRAQGCNSWQELMTFLLAELERPPQAPERRADA